MLLKPQDVVVALKLAAINQAKWTYAQLYDQLYISASEINVGIKRLAQAGLVYIDYESRKTPPMLIRTAVIEFLIHGVKYAFPPERGELTRGMPTAYAAPPLSDIIIPSEDLPPVWPDKDGKVKGYSFSPLYKTVPYAAKLDSKLYEYLALVDAIRDGRAREKKLAEQELSERILVK